MVRLRISDLQTCIYCYFYLYSLLQIQKLSIFMSFKSNPTQNVNIYSNTILRSERLKQIQALYKNQIKNIYAESNAKLKLDQQQKQKQTKKNHKISQNFKDRILKPNGYSLQSPNTKSTSTLNAGESSSSSKVFNLPENQQKIKASHFFKGQSVKTFELLRKQNELKELKIRQLTHKYQGLMQKLKKHLQPAQYQREIQSLKEYSDNKIQRLENLFKIKSEEIFFKIKIQAINLLQQFGAQKEQLVQISEVTNESLLFTFLTKKLKNRLKDFRHKEQESSFELQKDKILNQQQQQRIHFLLETNQILRISETKLKGKIQDLKTQLNQFLEKLRERQQQIQNIQNENFQIKRKNEELSVLNLKLNLASRAAVSELADQKRLWQGKEKEMKSLLNNYFIEKKRLEQQLQESQGRAEQILINQKFLQQENQRINRELVRWKQRYEWIEKENTNKAKELQQQLNRLSSDFDDYKVEHNQGKLIIHQNDVEEALRKVQKYQRAYQAILLQLQQERRLFFRSQQQHEQRLTQIEQNYLERIKGLQKLREEQLFEIQNEHEVRQSQIRQQFAKREKLLIEQNQAQLNARLAEKQKQATAKKLELESQNDGLRRQIQRLKDIQKARDNFINIIRQEQK